MFFEVYKHLIYLLLLSTFQIWFSVLLQTLKKKIDFCNFLELYKSFQTVLTWFFQTIDCRLISEKQ